MFAGVHAVNSGYENEGTRRCLQECTQSILGMKVRLHADVCRSARSQFRMCKPGCTHTGNSRYENVGARRILQECSQSIPDV